MAQIKISNKYLYNIKWLPGSAFQYHANNEIDIWKINVSANLDFIDYFLKVLSITEIARANRYVRTDDKNRSVISRGALRFILSKYLDEPPFAISLLEGVNKKPVLANETGLHFNVSHSGNWVLIAIANSEIGIDIELVKDDFKYQDILPEYFVDDEIEYIKQSDSIERFYMIWTRKEALSKAIGSGLDSILKYFPALNGDHSVASDVLNTKHDWSISSFNVAENYVSSIANNPLLNEVGFWDFILDL